MKKITAEELVKILIGRKGNFFATLVALTAEKNLVKDCPFGSLNKVSCFQANLGFHYTNSLDNQAAREGKTVEFDVKPRRWGSRIDKTCLVEHKGQYYIEAKPEKSFSVKWIAENGRILSKDEVEPYFKTRSESATQESLDKKVILRDYKVENVMEITMDNETYQVAV